MERGSIIGGLSGALDGWLVGCIHGWMDRRTTKLVIM
jgi:hypothetical protein